MQQFGRNRRGPKIGGLRSAPFGEGLGPDLTQSPGLSPTSILTIRYDIEDIYVRPKIINNLVDIDTNQYLEPAVVRGEEAVRFIIPYTRTSAYKYSFFPAAVRLWYNIPAPLTFASLSNLRLRLAITQMD